MSAQTNILGRLDAAFERAAYRWPAQPIDWIYLNQADRRAYDAAQSLAFDMKLHCFSYRDVQIRTGKRSQLVCKAGFLVAVPA